MSDGFIFAPLRPFKYDVIVIDPPWTFDLRSSNGEEKSPQKHYSCMPIADIKALPVGHLCGPNAWLFLWTCAPLLRHAFDCLDAWGFTYKSRTTWRKTTRNGKVRVGPGYVVRGMSEDVLIATIGQPAYARALPSIFDGLAREHSRKPDEFYALIEGFAPNAWRADVFTRETRAGWDGFGNEATKFDGAA
ncbi:MAG: MT-A70 family methyltransferase [Rhodoblastus sp.]